MWKILVVDDDLAHRNAVGEVLHDRAKCDMASNGKEAIEAYVLAIEKENPFDMILLDIAMPEVNGIETLKVIREMEKKRGVIIGEGIPIIVVTAYNEPSGEAFSHGCDEYILKPINGNKLIATIEEKLNKSK